MSLSFVRTPGTIESILQPRHGAAGGERSVGVRLRRLAVRLRSVLNRD